MTYQYSYTIGFISTDYYGWRAKKVDKPHGSKRARPIYPTVDLAYKPARLATQLEHTYKYDTKVERRAGHHTLSLRYTISLAPKKSTSGQQGKISFLNDKHKH